MKVTSGATCVWITAFCIGLQAAEPAETAPPGSPGFHASPERPTGWRGDGSYLWGNHGTCLVIEPGRTYKQVAKNRIENYNALPIPGMMGHLEQTVSCPVFEGKRLYYRALENLYCIGEK